MATTKVSLGRDPRKERPWVVRWFGEYDPTIAAAAQMDQIIQDARTRDDQIRSTNDGPESPPNEADAAD